MAKARQKVHLRRWEKNPRTPLDFVRVRALAAGVSDPACRSCTYYRHHELVCEVSGDHQIADGICLEWALHEDEGSDE